MLRLGIIAAALAALAIAVRLLVLLANGPGTPGGPPTVDGGIQHGTGDPRYAGCSSSPGCCEKKLNYQYLFQ